MKITPLYPRASFPNNKFRNMNKGHCLSSQRLGGAVCSTLHLEELMTWWSKGIMSAMIELRVYPLIVAKLKARSHDPFSRIRFFVGSENRIV